MKLDLENGYLSPETGEEVASAFAIRTAIAEAEEVEQVRLRFPAGVELGLYRYDRNGRFLGFTEAGASPCFYIFDRDCRFRLSTPLWTEARFSLADFFVECERGIWAGELRFQSGLRLTGDSAGTLAFETEEGPTGAEARADGLYQDGAPLLRGFGGVRGVQVMTNREYKALVRDGSLQSDILYFVE